MIAAPPPPRSPWQRFYGWAHEQRRAYWQKRRRRLSRPVVSIGNLHWGGTGKTPLTSATAAFLRDHGFRVVILSRGYGRHGSATHLVSRGEGPLVSVEQAGDEPWMLADSLPGVAVAVGFDRYEAGRLALEELGDWPSVFLLDDGFSHISLHRDLDILSFPSEDPLAGGRLLPGGRLREPLAASRYANGLVVHTPPLLAQRLLGAPTPDLGASLAHALRPYEFRGPGFTCRLTAQIRGVENGNDHPFNTPRARAILVTGIARPKRAVRVANSLGVDIQDHLIFPDHHNYTERNLERIRECAQQKHATAVLTTSKDRVKLAGRLDWPLAEICIEAHPREGFWHWLLQELGAAPGRA